MQFSEDRSEIFKGMYKLKSKLTQPKFDSEVEYKDRKGNLIKFKYASLGAIENAIRTAAQESESGIDFEQEAVTDGNKVNILTLITHETGQYVMHGPMAFMGSENPQALGSTITYGKRYALSAAFGIAADSDDEKKLAHDTEETDKAREQLKTDTSQLSLSDGQISLAKTKISEFMDVAQISADEVRELVHRELDIELGEVAKLTNPDFQKLMNLLNRLTGEIRRKNSIDSAATNITWGKK